MTEADAVAVIAATDRPATKTSLVADLRALGLEGGGTVVVHSSLSRLGWVCGGAEAVVLALLQAVGPRGTIAVPTHSGGHSDPAGWRAPAVPEAWWETIRAEMPPFDPVLTPTRKMGAVVECFRHVEGFRRSSHPAFSFGAVGPNAAVVIEGHELAMGMGEGSPLARLYELGAKVLLLGVGHGNNSSLHLAEYRTARPTRPRRSFAAPVIRDGERLWASYEDIEHEDEDFPAIGAAFAEAGLERSGTIGAGTGRLMSQVQLVDFGAGWMDEHRPAMGPLPG